MMELNPDQISAVEYLGQHALIVAGPGTGKTHTLMARILNLIQKLKTPPADLPHPKVLALTFTHKAKEEMTHRLKALSVRMDLVWVGTYHQWCLMLLRRYADLCPLPKDFRIALEEEKKEIVNRTWPHKTPREKQDILEGISYIKSTELVLPATDEIKLYQKSMHASGYIDLDDVLRETLMLLDQHPEILRAVVQEFPFVCVDEYQDSNHVQEALLRLLAKANASITAIGDPNQAIYGFRGADVSVFHRFQDVFVKAELFYLKENYRSAAHIVQASTQVMETLSRRGVPALVAHQSKEGKVIVHEATTDRAEADYVAHQIERLVGGLDMLHSRASQHVFGDVVILTRLKAQQQVVAGALAHLGIPYQIAQPRVNRSADDELSVQGEEEVFDYHMDRVTLMTMHAAKGLEFPVVFLMGCEDKIVPLDLTGLKADIDEERRLFYVAMTRAKEELHLTYAKRRQLFGQTLVSQPSPFLLDIQHDLKQMALMRRKKEVKPDQQLKLF